MKTAAQELQDRAILMLDTLNEGIWDWPDVGASTFWWSPRFYELLGYAPNATEATLEHFLDRVHPEDRHLVQRYLEPPAQPGPLRETEFRILTPAGDYRWMRGHGKSIPQATDTSVHLFGAIADITDFKRTEMALLESQHRLDLAIDASDEGLWDWPDTRQPLNWWSPRFYTLLGYDPGEIQPTVETFMAMIHPDDVGRLNQELAERLSSSERFSSEYRIRTKSGVYRWFRSRGKLFHRHDGGPTRMSGSIQDINDFKSSEIARRTSDQHYRRLLDNLNVAVIVHAPDTRIQYANPIACQMLSLTLEQMMGRDAMDPDWYFIRENGERVPLEAYPVMRVLATGQPVRNLIAGVHTSTRGEMNWGLVNAYPEFDDQHRLVQVVVTVNDITEQKLIEASLRKSEAKYRLLHESMRDAFASTDMQGRIVECNPAFRAMLGYSSDELQRLTYTEITPSQWHEIEQRIVVEQILPRGYSDLYEKEYIRKDGTLLPVELRVVLTLGEDKRPAGMWAIVRDLTDRKRVEKSLYQAKNELEEKVAERTADLRYINQLLRDLTASLVTNEDEERLRIAQLVHDSIVQTLSLARFKLGPTAQALDGAGLRNESTAVEQIRNLLKDAIGQCRLLVSDLAPPILYEVGLLPALQDLALRLSQENAVAISVHVAAPPPQLDQKRRGLLFQCTRELLLNGIKHAETFSFEVRLSGTADTITVLVEDHGQGFDVRSLHARRKRPGHGFGLFHIRQRVEGLGGSMEVQSERKKGTRITLKIPIHDA